MPASRPLIESLESRELFAASLAISSIATSTPSVVVRNAITASLTLSNTGSDVGTPANAEIFLVPQGQTLNTSTNHHLPLFKLKPVFAGSTRTLTRTATLKNVTAGAYSLVACLLNPTDGTPDTANAVTGPTVTFVSAPSPLSAALSLPALPSKITQGTRLTPSLTLTSKSSLSTKIPVTFYLSTDPTLSSDDVALPAQTFSAKLPANQSKTFKRTITLPKSKKLHGDFYLIAQINRASANPSLPRNVTASSPTLLQIT